MRSGGRTVVRAMARYAIISDIHGNLQAFQAVLSHMARQEVAELVCLGDIVGYGPAPGCCIDLVCKYCSIVVKGNHDEAVIDPYTATQFNGVARKAIDWTVGVLGPLHMNALNQLDEIAYLNDTVMCIHDCPAPGPSDYVHDQTMAALAFHGVDRPICLLGHTHVPMVFEAPPGEPDEPVQPYQIIARIPRAGEPIALDPQRRYICNPGSVGQPRDADPRASYAVLDLDAMTFTIHRVEYDIAAVQLDAQQVGLPAILAERLAVGA